MSSITDFIDKYFERKTLQRTITKLAKECGVRNQVTHRIGIDMIFTGRENDITFCLRVSSNDTIDGRISEKMTVGYKQYYKECGKLMEDFEIFNELQDYVNQKLHGLGIQRRMLRDPIPGRNFRMATAWLNSSDLCALYEKESSEELIKFIEES